MSCGRPETVRKYIFSVTTLDAITEKSHTERMYPQCVLYQEVVEVQELFLCYCQWFQIVPPQ